jgi:hypothetical protein
LDLSQAEKFVPVHIFTGSKDAECPVDGNQLLSLFDEPHPRYVSYEDWNHKDFVSGINLEQLVADIEKLKERKNGGKSPE